MELQLSYTSNENHAITKTLNSIVSISGTLRDDSSIINPIILLEGESFSTYNYAYIPEFFRYYFIDEIVNFRNNLWMLRLKIDVLMSFRTGILETNCILNESEISGADPYISDPRVWVTKVKDKTDIIQFPNGLLENGEYILITSGGGV